MRTSPSPPSSTMHEWNIFPHHLCLIMLHPPNYPSFPLHAVVYLPPTHFLGSLPNVHFSFFSVLFVWCVCVACFCGCVHTRAQYDAHRRRCARGERIPAGAGLLSVHRRPEPTTTVTAHMRPPDYWPDSQTRTIYTPTHTYTKPNHVTMNPPDTTTNNTTKYVTKHTTKQKQTNKS